jgi:hypothetical protein
MGGSGLAGSKQVQVVLAEIAELGREITRVDGETLVG